MKPHLLSAAIAAAFSLTLAGCFGGSDSQANAVTAVEFLGMAAPATAAEKADADTTAKVKYTYSNGSSETHDLAYHRIFVTTDVVGGNVVGGLFDSNDRPLTDNLGQMASDGPDGTSLLQIPDLAVPGATGNPLAMVVGFEYRETPPADGVSTGGFWSKLPAAAGLALLDQNKQSGLLAAKTYQNVSFKGVGGLCIDPAVRRCRHGGRTWAWRSTNPTPRPAAAAPRRPEPTTVPTFRELQQILLRRPRRCQRVSLRLAAEKSPSTRPAKRPS